VIDCEVFLGNQDTMSLKETIVNKTQLLDLANRNHDQGRYRLLGGAN
jgi:hypothetical protein